MQLYSLETVDFFNKRVMNKTIIYICKENLLGSILIGTVEDDTTEDYVLKNNNKVFIFVVAFVFN